MCHLIAVIVIVIHSHSNMAPSKKQICKGCNSPVKNPVSCSTCGIMSHPNASCLAHCAHPWQQGKFIDCNELTSYAASTASPSSSANDTNKHLFTRINDLLETKFTKLEGELQVLHSSIELLDTTLNSINSKVRNLQLRVNKLEKTQEENNLESNIIEELNERTLRAKNLIVYNVKESDVSTDLSTIKEVLNSIQPDAGAAEIYVRRVGRNVSADKPRPICVSFPNSEMPLSILRNKNKRWGHFKIAQDLTAKQRAQLSSLREELQNMNDSSKTIRYIWGVPKIVPLNRSPKYVNVTQ